MSQSAGHHIANNQVFRHLVGLNDEVKPGEYKINLLGEYNIGGDGFEIDRILKKCGITNIATFSGNSSYDQFASAHTADLNAVMCHRSINYVADMLEVKYGIPWVKINFIGAEATAKSLRKIAKYFDDPVAHRTGGEGHRRGDARGRRGGQGCQAAHRRQDGHALRGRLPGPPLSGAVQGAGHEDHQRGI